MSVEVARAEWDKGEDEVRRALSAVSEAHNRKSSEAARNAMLYAVSNNHAGSYVPAVLLAAPTLVRLLASPNAWARRTTLNVLLDLVGSFRPEPGLEDLEPQLLRQLLPLRAQLLPLSDGGEEAQLRSELLAAFNARFEDLGISDQAGGRPGADS